MEENERDVEDVWSGSGGSEFAIVDWAFNLKKLDFEKRTIQLGI